MVRDDLLRFLKADSEERGATILYATHIFDGLNDFPTHLVHMRFGSFVTITPWAPMGVDQPGVSFALTPLYGIALQWLKEDREFRQELEKQGQKMRGARRSEPVPSDPETFYNKYDYSH